MGTDDVTVIVATFGDETWKRRAVEVAYPSAVAQQPARVILWHGSTLASARNAAAATATTEWLCFLDADDELEPGYLDALCAADGDLRAPSIRFVRDGVVGEPESLAHRDIDVTNPCVVGTILRKDLFEQAGRFWAERAWEDWSLFRRCVLLGATITHTPEAVYRIHVSADGRNSTVASPRNLHRSILLSHRTWQKGRR